MNNLDSTSEKQACAIASEFAKSKAFAAFNVLGARFRTSGESPSGEWVVYLEFVEANSIDDSLTIIVSLNGEATAIQGL